MNTYHFTITPRKKKKSNIIYQEFFTTDNAFTCFPQHIYTVLTEQAECNVSSMQGPQRKKEFGLAFKFKMNLSLHK